MEKKPTSAIVAGLIISLLLIVLTLVLYFTGLMFTATWSQYIGFLILFGGLIWATINHGNERNHQVTFGNLFGFGFKVAAVVCCLMIAYTVLSGYLFPDIKTHVMEMAREKALQRPNATEDQVNQGINLFERNYTLFIVIGIIFWYLIIGVIASLIGAAVAKKRPATPFENA